MTTDAVMPALLSCEELGELQFAARCLEGDSFASRATNLLGRQVEALGRALPPSARKALARATESALKIALRFALRTIDKKSPAKAARGCTRRRRRLPARSAALSASPPRRSNCRFRRRSCCARSPKSRARRARICRARRRALACIEVFALGGEAAGEAAIEGGYFVVRGALAKSVSESARFIAQRGLADETAPILVRLVSQIAARFGVVVSEKLAAQAVPVLGAIGGAAVNVAFAEHFQTLARGHFIVRRLERVHGTDAVQFEYRRLRNQI